MTLALALLTLVSQSWANDVTTPVPAVDDQDVTVTGKVLDDETGDPLVGATVRIKGSNRGTSCDINGAFKITVPENTILVISYIGMKTEEVKVPKNGRVYVSLKPDATMLDEVVSIGYGTMRRSDLTGAVVSVSSDDIKQSGATTIEQALQGRAAGLEMVENTGLPGGSSSISIRGVNSINNNNAPLFIIDGVMVSGGDSDITQNPLAGINPADVESIEILKDASAAAIYGSQASNGVILITMKKGVAGKPNIQISASYGLQELPKKIELMTLREYAAHYNARKVAYGTEDEVKDEWSNPDALGKGTDWQDAMFRTAPIQSYNLSIRGGKEGITYSLSGGYTGQEGIGFGSSFDRFSFRLNTEVQTSKKIKSGGTVSMNYTYQDSSLASWSLIPNALYQSPHVPVYNSDGTYAGPTEEDETVNSFTNPLAIADLTQRDTKRFQTRANLYFSYEPVSWLNFRSEGILQGTIQNYDYFLPSYEIGWSVNDSSDTTHSKTFTTYWLWKNVLTLSKWSNKFGYVSWMLGQEISADDSSYLYGSRENGSEVLTDLDAGDANYSTNSGNSSSHRTVSFFTRLFYSYKSRYQFTGTVRLDGTSRFARGNRWGFFPSAAVAWNISNEPFFESWKPVVKNLKIRASYGEVGNSWVSDYAYTEMLEYSQTVWGSGLNLDRIANADLKWESTKSWNVGLDLSLFEGRVELIFDGYVKKTNDLLFTLDLPAFLGIDGYGSTSTQWANVGSLRNRGFEFTLNTVNISKRNFSWRTNVTFSYNRNKILKMNNENSYIDKSYQLSGSSSVITRTAVGKPVSQFYGYKQIGRINSASDYLVDNGDGTSTVKIATPYYNKGDVVSNDALTGTVYVGDLIWEDLNGDGTIDTNDRDYIGNPLPKFTMGLTNTFKYKDFDFSIFMYGSYGNDAFNWLRRRLDDPNSTSNKRMSTQYYAKLGYYDGDSSNTDVWNVYVLDGADPLLPRISAGADNNTNNRVSDRYVEDASYLRIQNIVVGYTLPRRWTRKIGVNNVRIYANVKNVYTFTHYSGYDPEIGSTQGQYSYTSQSMLMYGVDTGRCPSPRTYTLGIDVTF